MTHPIYDVKFLRTALRFLVVLTDEKTKRKIQKIIENLAIDPRPPGFKKLSGADDLYRIRIGDYRVVYSIKDHIVQILIIRIAHRKDVYR
jgi:mRNA interferase RelE/StbE